MPTQTQRTTTRSTATGGSPSTSTTDTAAQESNATLAQDVANQQGTEVDGPMGRLFQRVLGVDGGGADQAFTRAQLERYLDRELNMAEGEWFRGKKVSGVTDALMEQLDQDRDGVVSWTEFQSFEDQTLATIAPNAGTSRAEVESAADARFTQMDSNRDGGLSYDELFARTKGELPRGTEHADLIAQLAARIALDAVDTDQRDQPVKQRTLSRDEWKKGAGDMAD